uniref:Sulfotransferase domain-containing protein n=1 Tax=Grammatophora oceanica TaxID=210454 RepID=A0A7S1UNM5_9STRA|mmetsp:Transcript_1085/g.1522  ORF Transcript_1085/g.1522 Transcript_1085/m.1522 type:complete len:444 (+) Transcript_1085:161-1492(+)
MPWLVKDGKPEDRMFFVHVPRCGGTSLMQHFDVPHKAMEGRSLWGKFGMRTFFRRYKLLESANFPIKTRGNLIFVAMFLGAIPLYVFGYWPFGLFVMLVSLAFLVGLSFVFVAPTISRILLIRRFFLTLVHYILCRFMESIDWCTGTNNKGYMMHLTAQKVLKYGYVSAEEFEQANTMAIVRNPYARMVSIFMYNRFGEQESFDHFMKNWYTIMKPYRETKEMEEWYIPCHAIPQFEYTHFEGKQLVQSIVKQEELKFLKTKKDEHKAVEQDSTVRDLPDPVRNALLGMPHTNKRSTNKKWYEYYNQETLNMCYEMYKNDFVVFDYSPIMEQRPDLKSPTAPTSPRGSLQRMVRNSYRLSIEEQSVRIEKIRTSGEMSGNGANHSVAMAAETIQKELEAGLLNSSSRAATNTLAENDVDNSSNNNNNVTANSATEEQPTDNNV